MKISTRRVDTSLDPNKFEDNVVQSDNRAFIVVVKKKYKDYYAVAEELGVSRQYVQELKNREIPVQYVAYFAHKHKFHPGALNYKKYLMMGGLESYQNILRLRDFFSEIEIGYILRGVHVKHHDKFLETLYKVPGR